MVAERPASIKVAARGAGGAVGAAPAVRQALVVGRSPGVL